ncbi:MAG: hypothetical protein HY747_10190 [Elusimicrobia bacterium]|nr:hypothetical protein [Elusimicrobiota bacterium]
MPAQAGIQIKPWIPASAGMTAKTLTKCHSGQVFICPTASDAYQNLVTLSDEFGFGTILTFRGPKRLLSDEDYQAYKKSREPQSKPPKIQELLRLALSLKERFRKEQGLSRRTAARELGCSHARISQIMNLLKLDAKTRRYILSLPPVVGRHAPTERWLRQSLIS